MFRWVVYKFTHFDNASDNFTDGSKKLASASGRRPKPLIYMNEKYWKKDGLNPVFPLVGLMLLIRSHPVRPRGCVCVYVYVRLYARGCACTRVGAPVRVSVRVVVWCARECTRGGLEGVRVVVWCARECTRGGLVCAWWSRGTPECYSITKGQRMERRQTIGPKRVAPWSPHDHLMITS